MKNVISIMAVVNETTADIELVREALSQSMIWCPSEFDNDKPCMIRDAQEAFERISRAVAERDNLQALVNWMREKPHG